jgi:hypothetical protein
LLFPDLSTLTPALVNIPQEPRIATSAGNRAGIKYDFVDVYQGPDHLGEMWTFCQDEGLMGKEAVLDIFWAEPAGAQAPLFFSCWI